MKRLLLPLCLAGGALLGQDPEPKAPALPKVGEPAPTFVVNDHSGAATSIGEAQTWTVLAFFPKAATPG